MSDNDPEEPVAAADFPTAVLVLDAVGKVLTCTRSAAALLGAPETIGGPGAEQLDAELLFEDPDLWARLVAGAVGGARRSARARLLRLDGGRLEADVDIITLLEGSSARVLLRLRPADPDHPVPVAVAGDLRRAPPLPPADQRAAERLALLNAAAAEIGSSLDMARDAEQLADVLVPAFADLVAVDLTEPVLRGEEPGELVTGAPMRRVAVRAADGRWPPGSYSVGDTIRLQSIESVHLRGGSAVFLPDLRELRAVLAGEEERVRLILPPQAASLMMVPLQARGSVLGALVLWRTAERRPFDQEDAVLAEEIGSRASLSMENARRYTRERRTAEALQRSLLPRPVMDVTGAETSGAYVPASTTTAAVGGGGWFDVIQLPSTRLAFVMGTVAGHGVSATAAMGRLRSAVQTLADLDLSPDELLAHLDDLVVRFIEDDDRQQPDADAPSALTGATCLYATYDPVSRTCVLAGAGHPPPVLATRGHSGTGIGRYHPGPVLGTGGHPFAPVELRLEAGDVLALYGGALAKDTDRSERQLAVVRAGVRDGADSGRPVTEIGRGILGTLLNEPPDDDLALLVVRVKEVSADDTAVWELPADPSLVARARGLVASRLTAWGLEDLVFTTELIVSELVTNSVRYAGGPVGLRLIRDRVLICEVSDPSQTQPHLRRAQLTDEGGRGLFLVAQLTHRWGSRYTAAGKTIWTEQLLGSG
ncbi:SpoIIE family protein phosphatase [Kitasatospora sp. NBC_00240]|uniref:ATP-binding SpoIIE family protein phosphatase n=1 Tax=Kitasatospora sp. NBC_00240 TaxID=2903567 RepID=UPI0022513389|nr:SpoIIE family protein phosphatase [Kitasatospora sp. NBC_00240]MCX5215168.1 SpoIIE family protein phosphatase [Kitasatospora sp. NBC_00240]